MPHGFGIFTHRDKSGDPTRCTAGFWEDGAQKKDFNVLQTVNKHERG
jgi:hypothetical protein